MNLAQSTCNLHQDRSASARCPSCTLFFCSECITEHDGKLTCAECLRKNKSPSEKVAGKRDFFQFIPGVQFLIAVALTWASFYLIAQVLIDIPDSFHDGTIWRDQGPIDVEEEDGAEDE